MIFRTILAIAAFSCFMATSQVSLTIDASNSPYYFPTGYHVFPGDSLILGPGAEVYVGDSMNITVEGFFSAIGTEDLPILIGPTNISVGWGALDIKPSADTVHIIHANIWQGRIYINARPCYMYASNIENSTALIFSDILLRIWFASPVIDQLRMSANNVGEGFICHGCTDPRVTHSTFISIPDAIEFINCTGGRIDNSTFMQMKDDAIDLNNCSNVHVDSNFFYSVEDRGIEIGSETFGSCDDILITRNQFVLCKEAVNFKEGSTGTVRNNTFYWNTYGVKTLSAQGFGKEEVVISNCIFAKNETDIWVDTNATITVSYSCFSDVFYDGLSNFVSDPKFVDPLNFDYSLQDGSPCINAGNPASALDPDGSQNDIGALYRHGTNLGPFANPMIVWPNPATDRLFIRLPEHFESIEIYDLTGKHIQTLHVGNGFLVDFDVSTLAGGMYVVHATKPKGSVSISFVVI